MANDIEPAPSSSDQSAANAKFTLVNIYYQDIQSILFVEVPAYEVS